MLLRLAWGALILLWTISDAGTMVGHVNRLSVREANALLVTEVYYDTPGTDADEEWIELANLGPTVIDLSGFKLGDEETRGGREGMARFPDGASIESGQVIVVAQTATGFRALFGRAPAYELADSDPQVADMSGYSTWASGDVALANDGDEVLLLDRQDLLVDSVSYGDSQTYFSPSVADVFTGHSIERVPADCDSDTAADWQPRPVATPGQVSLTGECQAPPSTMTVAPRVSIGEIQGRQAISPYVNQLVSLDGIVTGFYEDRNTRGAIFYTMFVQDPSGAEDGDPTTSDGIAVFLGTQRPAFNIGDHVQVNGQITEFFGLTEVDDYGLQITYLGADMPLPQPVSIDPPAENEEQAAYFEALEGMWVAVDGAARAIGPTHSGCGFAVVHPETELVRVLARTEADPVGQVISVLHNTDVDCEGLPGVKSSDLVTGLGGPLIYSFDRFKIVNQDPSKLNVTAAPMSALLPPSGMSDNQVSVATLNLENHFDAFDDTGDDSEPKPTPAAVAVKRAKLAYLISTGLGCPTIVGVQEVENRTLLEELARAAAERCGFTYEVSHLESADVRGIDVAMLSDSRRVSVSQVQLRQACSNIDTGIDDPGANCAAGHSPLFSRPPLQVDTWVDGVRVTLFINHFKSKREGAMVTAPRRLAQAEHLDQLVADLLEHDPAARILVMGDFNDFEASPPLQLLTGSHGRLLNPMLRIPPSERYSIIFDGVSQLIDAILISPALVENVVNAAIIHANADYPITLAEDVSAGGLPYRSTDHDPLLLILALEADAPATIAPTQTATFGATLIPATAEPSATIASIPTPATGTSANAADDGKLGLAAVVLLASALLGITLAFVLRRRAMR